MNPINFYRKEDAYGYFSNFSTHPINVGEKSWRTSEHYFQAMKFEGTEHEDQIANAQFPGLAARMGRERWRPLRNDWEQIKDDVMYKALYAKFTQYTDLKENLLNTGDAIIVEHTSNDSYWGDGGNGTGKNMLGKLLMKLRDELRNEDLIKVVTQG